MFQGQVKVHDHTFIISLQCTGWAKKVIPLVHYITLHERYHFFLAHPVERQPVGDTAGVLPFAAEQIRRASRRDRESGVRMIARTAVDGHAASVVVEQQVALAVTARQAVHVGRQ